MSKNSTPEVKWKSGDEEEVAPQVQRKVVYQAQQEFRTIVDHVTYDIKQGQIISEPDVIQRLLSVNAPILPMSEETPGIIPCPHCSRKIEISKVPAIKAWVELQRK